MTICEDLWNITDDPLYVRNPMDELIKLDPDILVNIAASPFNYTQPLTRFGLLKKNAKSYGLPLFYVNHVGGQTELIFDGGSMVIDALGNLCGELERFKEDFRIFDSAVLGSTAGPLIPAGPSITLIHPALVMGIRIISARWAFRKLSWVCRVA